MPIPGILTIRRMKYSLMKYSLILFLAFWPSVICAQKTGCVKIKNLSRDQILQMPEFEGTKRIVAVSFDYKTINTPSELKRDKDGHYPVKVKSYKEVKKLSSEQEYAVLDILINYGVELKEGESILESEGLCYQPRNALLFYDEYGFVVGYFEVCFSCGSWKFDPRKESLAGFCEGKTAMLKEWMKSVGILYGVNGEVD